MRSKKIILFLFLQTVLSCKAEGDSKLTELRRGSQALCDRDDVDERTGREAQQTLGDLEEQWRDVLQTAEDTLKETEVQYTLSRELEAFFTQAGRTTTWVEELQRQLDSKGRGSQGSQAEIEDRLNAAQVKHDRLLYQIIMCGSTQVNTLCT